MLIRHPRIPAITILLASAILCLLYLRSDGRNVSAGKPRSLESLESAIAVGDASPRLWQDYAQRLGETGRHADAAVAWQKFLAANPYDRDAQLACCRSLAAAGDDAGLYAFLKPLLYENPKLIVEFLETSQRRAVAPFDALYRDATNQAMD